MPDDRTRSGAAAPPGTLRSRERSAADVTLTLPVLLDLIDQTAAALLLVCVPTGRVRHANEAAATLLGQRREALVGRRIDTIDPELGEAGRLRLAAALRVAPDRRLSRETAYQTADGRLVPVAVSVRGVVLDGEEHHLCVARDLGASHGAEAELRRRYEELFCIFNGLEAAVYVIDPDSCRILALNDFARRRFGEARGLRCADALRPRDVVSCPCGGPARMRAAARTDQPLAWEFQDPADLRWYRVLESAIPWVDGRRVRLEVTLDVSDERRLQEQLRQSQKMEALGRLAGGIAHDFNNILNGILGFATLLPDAGPLLPDAQRHVEAIARSARRGAELTGQILGFARRTPPELRPVDLAEPVADAVRLVAVSAPAGVRFETARAPGLWPVLGSAGQLEQVALNLCVNAVDAMPAGGTVFAQLSNVTVRRPLPTLHADLPPGRYVRLRVRDEGPGLRAEDVSRIFEPFFSTKAGSPERRRSGLGLAVVWGVVHGHCGGIRVRSRPQRGASFEIYFPAATAAPVVEVVRSGSGARGRGETILVVDDEPVNVELARVLLERQGYRVLSAGDGAEALQRFDEHGSEVALVVLDLVMPQMDGAETFRRLRQRAGDLPVLFTTGYDAQGVARDVRESAHCGFLGKPYEPSVLVARVREALDAAAPPPEA